MGAKGNQVMREEGGEAEGRKGLDKKEIDECSYGRKGGRKIRR